MDDAHHDMILPQMTKPPDGAGSLIGALFGDHLAVTEQIGFKRLTYRLQCARCGRQFIKKSAKLASAQCRCESARTRAA